MKRPILFASCILVMYAVSLAGPAEFQIHHSWLDGIADPININLPTDQDLSPTQLDSAPPATPENVYTIPTPGPLILTGIGIASIGYLHRKKRL